MYQKDYILRMIEMLGEMIAGILGLIRKGDFKQAEDKLENLIQDLLAGTNRQNSNNTGKNKNTRKGIVKTGCRVLLLGAE